MVLRLLIDAVHPDETRVAIVDNGRINDFDFVTSAKKQLKGNIYLAKITRVEPSLQAAFVEYGSGKQGFLPFAEIHPDYYQIPMADRERLMKEAEDAEEAEEAKAEAAPEGAASELASVQPHAEEPNPEDVFLNAEPKIVSQLQNSPSAYSDPVPEEFFAEQMKEAPAIVAEQEAAELPPQTEMPQAGEEHASEHHAPEHHHAEAHPESETIETLGNEEEAVRQSRPASFYRRYKIQEVIKRNQIVLVQVIKEERGNKGVSLTTFISLAGRYCVLMPNSPKGGGISRKISSGEDRRRLKEISSELKTSRGMSAIIRTAGIDRSRSDIQRDYEYLVKLWESIREQTLSSTAPALIYEEGDLIKRTVRDLYTNDIEEIIVAGEEGYEQAKTFLDMILPGQNVNLRKYQENVPLFYAYNLEDQLTSMYDQSVKLRSGGYIVLNPTEALISIDVNSGRMTGERNIEETATKTNLEAAYEVARQLRLRDLAGLIVIDFIDMSDSRNRRSVERALRDALKVDRAKIQIGRISPFGLMEMSRQRLRPSLSETSTSPCPQCHGKGVIRSHSSIALQIIRTLERDAATGAAQELKLFVPAAVALDLLNARRDAISAVEQKYKIKVITVIDDNVMTSHFRIEKIKSGRRNAPGNNGNNKTPVSMNQAIMDSVPAIEEDAPETAQAPELADASSEAQSQPVYGDDRPRRNRRGRGRRGGQRNFGERNNNTNTAEDAAAAPVEAQEGEASNGDNHSNSEPRDNEGRNNEGRGPRRRRRQWRDKRERRPEGNIEGSQEPRQGNPERNPGHNPSQHVSHTPAGNPTPIARESHAHVPPPLEQQAPQDGKPKKGWWRRIVEA